MKVCCTCQSPKSNDQFSKNALCGDGLQAACKSCHQTYAKTKNSAGLTGAQRRYLVKGDDGLNTHQRWLKTGKNNQRLNMRRNQKNKLNPEKVRANNLKAHYGLTLENWNDLLVAQKGKCAICKGPPSTFKKAFSVDHDHSTGKVRGLLCHKCNTALGMLQDSPEIVLSAHEYLTKHTL